MFPYSPSRASSGQRCRPRSLLAQCQRCQPPQSPPHSCAHVAGLPATPRPVLLPPAGVPSPMPAPKIPLGQPSRPRRSLLGLNQPQQLLKPQSSLAHPNLHCWALDSHANKSGHHGPRTAPLRPSGHSGPRTALPTKAATLGLQNSPASPCGHFWAPSQPCKPQPLPHLSAPHLLIGRPTPPRRPLRGPPSRHGSPC